MKLTILAPALALGAALLATSVPALAQQQYHNGYTHTTTTYAHSNNGYRHYNNSGYHGGNGYAYSGGGYTYYGGHRYWHHHRAYWHNNAWGYYGPSGIFISIPL
ncbi:MAG: hypothetical protein ABSD03_08440 [Vulcanimicrobiaceae bacterium]|jgi:hypothetical protein